MPGEPNPFAPPARETVLPAIITWYRLYAGIQCVTYVFAALASVYGVVRGTGAMTIWMAVMTSAFALFFFVAARVPFRPWGWSMAIAAMAVGCFGPWIFLMVPFLFRWNKRLVKAAFGILDAQHVRE